MPIIEHMLSWPGNPTQKLCNYGRTTVDFYFGIVLSITLLLLNISAQCPNLVFCRCGTSEDAIYYTHCIDEILEENVCDRWVNCETCEANITYCLTCPEGHSGPTCEDPVANCSDPGIVPFGYRRLINGIRSKSNRIYTFGQSLQYFCNQGYELVGNNVLTCLSSGQWTSQTPSCQRISIADTSSRQPFFCGYPDQKPNSRLITYASGGGTFPPGALFTYACNDGYYTRDPLVAICLPSGQWNTSAPTCIRIVAPTTTPQSFCTYPEMDETGMIIEPFLDAQERRRPFPPGSKITFDCEEGYEMVGDEWKIYCKLKGQWTSDPPICVDISTYEDTLVPEAVMGGCPVPTVDPNGAMEDIPPDDPRRLGQGFDAGSPVNFTCNDGYELEGSNMIICLRNGRWNSPPPTCRSNLPPVRTAIANIVKCTDPGAIANGGVVVLYSIARVNRTSSVGPLTYPVGTRLTYACVNGYSLQGERQLNCRTTGEWSGEKPICAAIPSQPRDLHEKISTSTSIEVEWKEPSPANNPITNYTVRWINLGNDAMNSSTTNETSYLIEGLGAYTAYSVQVRAATVAGFGNWTEPLVIQTKISDCGRPSIGISDSSFRNTLTVPEEWPWTVAISQKNTDKLLCGGALLDDKTVLTVAHCVRPNREYTLFFGAQELIKGNNNTLVQERESCRTVLHPEFNHRTFENDIALVNFEPPVQFTEKIRPICLPTSDSTARNVVPETKGFVSGYESTTRGPPSKVMQKIQIPVVSEPTCKEAHRKKRLTLPITPGMFCAGLEEGVPGFCSMASGSPMVFYNPVEDHYTLEGLVSWGASSPCVKKENYITMTKVENFTSWVLENQQVKESCNKSDR
ncbi:limulus clotting factor C-like isoform X2 [Argiope bruennichi]|uniref:limulus clotting factor C-like isoform X2 n=1 Tax=Argiope bruennichi TaxID=94029 RepID=UPI00249575A9|nr:limulus clotting factor C-like isoform X2 [Argiope bruennichi]